MMSIDPTPSRDSRSGMALVTTLGILVALMALGMAFLFLGRTERLAEHNARKHAEARHHIDAALDVAMLSVLFAQTNAMGTYNYTDLFGEGECSPANADGTGDCRLVRPQCFGTMSAYGNPTNVVRLGRASITNWVPSALWDQSTNTWSMWFNIIGVPDDSTDDSVNTTNGRVAFLAIDCSGFLDAHGATSNHVAYLRDVCGTDFTDDFDNEYLAPPRGEDDDGLAAPEYNFISQQDLNMRGGLWGFDTPVSNLVACLFDPGPNCTVTNWGDVGRRNVEFVPKYNISPWREGDGQKDSCLDYDGIDDWLEAVTNRLDFCGFAGDEANKIAWNLLNFLDADRIPQARDSDGTEIGNAWQSDWPVEDVPLINEFAVLAIPEEDIEPGRSNHYAVAVELWYPFAPNSVEASDEASLTVAAFTNWEHVVSNNVKSGEILDEEHLGESGKGGIAGIRFDGDSQDSLKDLEFDIEEIMEAPEKAFMAFTCPDTNSTDTVADDFIFFPAYTATNSVEEIYDDSEPPELIEVVTNWWPVLVYLPLGNSEYYAYSGDPANPPTLEPPVLTNAFNEIRLLARVAMGGSTNWVDEAPGYYSESDDVAKYGELPVFSGDSNGVWSLTIDDPRFNGRPNNWTQVTGYDEDDRTLGTTNKECSAWDAPVGQGLPLIHFNGPLRTAGDIGFVGTGEKWRSVCIANSNCVSVTSQGAVVSEGNVLDLFTVATTNRSVYGMVSYGTPWTNVISAMMADIPISESRYSTNQAPAIAHENAGELITWMTDCFTEARDLSVSDGMSEGRFTASTYGEVAMALGLTETFRTGPEGYGALDSSELWQPSTNRLDDVLKEDFIRGLAERISFRQRLYVIVLGAQTLAPNGRVSSECRAIATIASDLFTGQWRILNWAWLD